MPSISHVVPLLEGKGLDAWDVTRVKTLERTFNGGTALKADLSSWDVARVTNMQKTFDNARQINFALGNWDVAGVVHVSNMNNMLDNVAALDSCNKKRIVRAWASSAAFKNTAYGTAWAAEKCPPLDDTTFKQATWGTFRVRDPRGLKWPPRPLLVVVLALTPC